jgi:hypothetical protein
VAAGSISLLVDSPLRDLAFTMREVPGELKKNISRSTKAEAQPIWFEETRDRAGTKLQQRVLVDSARVGVTARNVFLRSGAVGTLSSGTPVSLLAGPAEFGMNAATRIAQKSRKGKSYTRRAGDAFGVNKRQGNVVYLAASATLPRFASLWIQTAHRCLYEAEEKAG